MVAMVTPPLPPRGPTQPQYLLSLLWLRPVSKKSFPPAWENLPDSFGSDPVQSRAKMQEKGKKRILVITAAAGRGRAWEEKMYWNSFQTSQSKGKKKERDKKEKKKNIWVEGGDGMANERFQSRVPSPSSLSLSLWAPKKPRKINE